MKRRQFAHQDLGGPSAPHESVSLDRRKHVDHAPCPRPAAGAALGVQGQGLDLALLHRLPQFTLQQGLDRREFGAAVFHGQGGPQKRPQPQPAQKAVEDRQRADGGRLEDPSSPAAAKGGNRRALLSRASGRYEQRLLPCGQCTPASRVVRPHHVAGSPAARRSGAEEGTVQRLHKSGSRARCENTYGTRHRRNSSSTQLTSTARFVSRASVACRREPDIAASWDRRQQWLRVGAATGRSARGVPIAPAALTPQQAGGKFKDIANQTCGK